MIMRGRLLKKHYNTRRGKREGYNQVVVSVLALGFLLSYNAKFN
jgi:hypothetical protein